MKLDYPAGSTPLNPDELEGLIPSINTQGELNELEKANIRIGIEWAERSRLLKKELLTYYGLFRLHKALFGQVWRWAGNQRKSEKNIGIAPHRIAEEIEKLCDDARFWIEKKTYKLDEIAARFHHRLVLIHPFVNGNGRLARVAANLLLTHNGHPVFSWGAEELGSENETRHAYIAALKAADTGSYSLLLGFVRS